MIWWPLRMSRYGDDSAGVPPGRRGRSSGKSGAVIRGHDLSSQASEPPARRDPRGPLPRFHRLVASRSASSIPRPLARVSRHVSSPAGPAPSSPAGARSRSGSARSAPRPGASRRPEVRGPRAHGHQRHGIRRVRRVQPAGRGVDHHLAVAVVRRDEERWRPPRSAAASTRARHWSTVSTALITAGTCPCGPPCPRSRSCTG